MKRLIVIFAVLLVTAVLSATAGAEDRFGAAVYQGAKYDEATSKYMSESRQLTIACYRTNDSMEKVAAFYRKQKGLSVRGEVMKENARFQSSTADVTLQSPWMNVLSGRMMSDTLISIVKK
jgi:hypothetical protein